MEQTDAAQGSLPQMSGDGEPKWLEAAMTRIVEQAMRTHVASVATLSEDVNSQTQNLYNDLMRQMENLDDKMQTTYDKMLCTHKVLVEMNDKTVAAYDKMAAMAENLAWMHDKMATMHDRMSAPYDQNSPADQSVATKAEMMAIEARLARLEARAANLRAMLKNDIAWFPNDAGERPSQPFFKTVKDMESASDADVRSAMLFYGMKRPVQCPVDNKYKLCDFLGIRTDIVSFRCESRN
jgi:chromosome segregation ATPase